MSGRAPEALLECNAMGIKHEAHVWNFGSGEDFACPGDPDGCDDGAPIGLLGTLARVLDACEPEDEAPVTWGQLRRQVRAAAESDRAGVGTGAGEGAPRQDAGSAWATRSEDCPKAPTQAYPLGPDPAGVVADEAYQAGYADGLRDATRGSQSSGGRRRWDALAGDWLPARVRGQAWDEGYRAAMAASVGLQGTSAVGAQFPADWEDHNPYRADSLRPRGTHDERQYAR